MAKYRDLNFSEAFLWATRGHKIRRFLWLNNSAYVVLFFPEKNLYGGPPSVKILDTLYMLTIEPATGKDLLRYWTITREDIIAKDWIAVDHVSEIPHYYSERYNDAFKAEDDKIAVKILRQETGVVASHCLLTFSEALTLVKQGYRIYRYSWQREFRTWIEFTSLPINDGAPSLYKRTEEGSIVHWAASQEDILANDWMSKLTPSVTYAESEDKRTDVVWVGNDNEDWYTYHDKDFCDPEEDDKSVEVVELDNDHFDSDFIILKKIYMILKKIKE